MCCLTLLRRKTAGLCKKSWNLKMSGKLHSLSRKQEKRKPAVSSVSCEDNKRFLASLDEFIEHEKQYLGCPAEGPHELRYMVYRAAFNEVIGRAPSCRRVLLLIKAEYDHAIQELKRREDDARATRRREAAAATHARSLEICETRAAQLRDRISVLQTETAELQESSRRTFWGDLGSWVSGLPAARPEDLDRYLQDLQTRRTALLDRKSLSVPLEVHSRLEAELQEVQRRRDRLRADNVRLRLLHERLTFVSDGFRRWTDGGQAVPLEELLASTMKSISSELLHDADGCSAAAALQEDRRQTDDHLLRFLQLFGSGRYREAALHAARTPGGILRNPDVMEMFAGVRAPAGVAPPLLLFFQALLVTTATGHRMSTALSLQGVRCALQHGRLQLAVHAVTQDKVSFTEDLGDVLSEHAQKDVGGADLCLALATVVYEACGRTRKAAVSMCRRGLVHNAAELLRRSADLTAEDYMWVLRRSPSLPLFQVLSDHSRGCSAILPVGVACRALLADPDHQQVALQLLDGFLSAEVLESVVLQDSGSTVDVWDTVASLCSGLGRADLSRAVRAVLLDQEGTRVLSPDPEGARLTQHIFM
ncbi:clathrin heavy chain linker domain-containing protein 1 isoform X2 [Oryzias melastigma]|uniref:clathrin heavy chain linker domain-containing protein 1 isoform X2 n=1 Tax=Oryzias melastigma TaxID=30732 RepID=UPI000CF7B510|nr:clathrin heavy chain linker domain-containing protein 1 isoform X2 [Oryzias melastigma]